MSSSGKDKYPKPTSGPLFSTSQPSALKFDLFPSEIIEEIFDFMDKDSQRHYLMIKSSKNKDLDNRLMQAALVNHFLSVVAEGRPPQYELSPSKEDALKSGIFAINLPEEKEVKEINYAVRTPKEKVAYDKITDKDLRKLTVPLPKSLTLETIKSILPDILQITAVRGHTYAMGAEKILATHPEVKKLLLQKGNVTDFAGNHFTNITAFQYAVWAKDRHMWSMLAKNMNPQEVKNQLAEMKKDAFKLQHGSYWDCPKEYDVNYLVLNKMPELEELKTHQQRIPTLIKILGEKESKFYIYGYGDDGRTPQLKALDQAKISNDIFKLEAALKEEKKSINDVINTKKYRALHAEIEDREGHFVNPLTVALQEFVDTLQYYFRVIPLTPSDAWDIAYEHLDELWFKVGAAQRKVPVHIPNEHCRPDRSFHPRPYFKEAILLRTCKRWDNVDWFPLRDNVGSCLIHLREVDKTPTLDELKASQYKIPTLIKRTNNTGDSEFYLYALQPGTKIPVLSSAFKDEYNNFKEIRFADKSCWFPAGSKEFLTLSAIGLSFSALGLNFGFYRADGPSRYAPRLVMQHAFPSPPRSIVEIDLSAVAALCHQRTLEVKQFIQRFIATSTKSSRTPTQSPRPVSR